MTRVELIATKEDRDYAWRHAFAYADCQVSTDDAVDYANHYAATIADEEDMNWWPAHSCLFYEWRLKNENLKDQGQHE